ncbi:MAG: riboflavin synthase subunit alpha [Shewanella sp.]|nr:riboflavin synthase subunit alpha [Shewanella sp.]MCF1439674.1 riboflavin synthase subunit alpha [Shewanella sp.]MCF1459335.1 riboflavin synthase subunit alpha [Shewanella sp.]
MFTGIVQATCEVADVCKKDGVTMLEVVIPNQLRTNLATGASVANNGVCLTVTQIANDRVFFDVMEETSRLTNLADLQTGSWVNIERSLTLGSEIGGHILSGHIHTTAKVIEISQTDEHYDMRLQIDPKWMHYILYKGFIGVNGCSLTVGQVDGDSFWLHLIPETLRLTNLGEAFIGSRLNIEINSQTQAIVDTVERVLAARFGD